MALNGYMKRESGQIGLIVLLIMVVVTTIAVSVSTRSVSELRISRQEQESTRSLDLAESGIEQILSQDESTWASTGTVTIGDKTVSYSTQAESSIGTINILEGHTLELDVEGASEFNFSLDTAAPCHAVVIAIIKTDGTLTREVYRNNNTCTQGNITSTWSGPLSLSGAKYARIKALFEEVTLTNVSVTGATNPIYKTINSTSELDDGTTRTVQVNKFPGSLPSIFDYVLFSGTSLEKN